MFVKVVLQTTHEFKSNNVSDIIIMDRLNMLDGRFGQKRLKKKKKYIKSLSPSLYLLQGHSTPPDKEKKK